MGGGSGGSRAGDGAGTGGLLGAVALRLGVTVVLGRLRERPARGR